MELPLFLGLREQPALLRGQSLQLLRLGRPHHARQLILLVFQRCGIRDGDMQEFNNLGNISGLKFHGFDQDIHFFQRFRGHLLGIQSIKLVAAFQRSNSILEIRHREGQG